MFEFLSLSLFFFFKISLKGKIGLTIFWSGPFWVGSKLFIFKFFEDLEIFTQMLGNIFVHDKIDALFTFILVLIIL